MDHLLRRYGLEAEGLRDLLRRYAAMKNQDFFPERSTKLPDLGILEPSRCWKSCKTGWWPLMRAILTSAGCSRRRYNSSAA
jgi:hypothetical protein